MTMTRSAIPSAPGATPPGRAHGASRMPPARRSGPGSSAALVVHARSVLAEAAGCVDVAERFRLAHLAALRTAAAVIADRGKPAPVRGRQRLISAWQLIETVAPEYSEWAAYFASGATARAAVEAGATSAVSARDADDQLRAAQDFLALVEHGLGMLDGALAS